MECHFRTRGLNGLIRRQIRLKFQLSTLLQKFTSRLWLVVLSYRAVKWPNRTPIILCRQTTSAYSANTDSYLKDTTDFITLIENTEVPSNAILVSMDVTSLYTNIPHYLRKMLSLILKENSFHFNGKIYLQTHGTSHRH